MVILFAEEVGWHQMVDTYDAIFLDENKQAGIKKLVIIRMKYQRDRDNVGGT